MSKSKAERLYDDEIAPELLKLALKCKAAGIPFLAVVEYRPDQMGVTQVEVAKSDNMLLTWMAQRAHGNIDALAMSWARQAETSGRGHNSMVLAQLGVAYAPRHPETSTSDGVAV